MCSMLHQGISSEFIFYIYKQITYDCCGLKTKTNSGKVILCVTESHLFTTWHYRHFMTMSWKTQWVSLKTSRTSASRYGFGWVNQQQTLIQETMVRFPLKTLWALGSDGECLSPFVFNTPLKLAKYLCLMILMGKLAYMVLKHWKRPDTKIS